MQGRGSEQRKAGVTKQRKAGSSEKRKAGSSEQHILVSNARQ